MKNSFTFFCILAKRLLSRKGFLLCLAVTLLVSVLAVRAEKESDTAVYAAIYAEDPEWEAIFSEYFGLVRFLICDSAEEVKRNVMQKKAECGYVLQEDLQNSILEGNGSWSITVYENADSTLTAMVNEVVFERVFYVISSGWYEGYIAEHKSFAEAKEETGENMLRRAAKEALLQKRTDGSTFTFARQIIPVVSAKEEEDGEKNSAYPVRGVAAACILLSGLVGVLEAAADRYRRRFYKKTAYQAAFYTILLSTLAGTVTGFLILAGTGSLTGPVQEILFLLGLFLPVITAGMLLQWGIGRLTVTVKRRKKAK